MTGTYQQITARAGPQRIATWLAPPDSAILVNSDITSTAFIGNDPGSQPVPVPPLGSVTIGPTGRDTWVSTSGPAVVLYLIPNGSQWTPSPAQVAQQIQALGLATAAAQASQLTQETSTAGNTGTANTYLGGTAAGALISGAGRTVAGETAALIASGSATGTPGGAPLLRKTANLGSGSATSLPAGSATSLVAVTSVNQPGYEGVFSVFMPASSGTLPFIQITVVWTDQITGLTVGQRNFFLTCGNGPGNALTYYINGPARANRVSVTATNLDPSVAATLAWGFNMTSHVFLADKITQPFYAVTAPNGYTNPAGTPNAGVLLNSNPTIAAGATITRLVAAYSGRAVLMANNTGASGGDINCFLVDPVATGSGLYGNANSRLQGPGKVLAGSTVSAEVGLAYGPMLLQLVNLSGTISTGGNFSILTEDY